MIYAYCRRSRAHQEVSVERQKELITEYLSKKGQKVDFWFIEEPVSGNTKLTERPALSQVMSVIEKNDTLVCSDVTRLARNTMVFNMIMGLAHNASASIEFADGNQVDPDDLVSVLMTTILAWTSQWEREQIAMRTKSALAVVRKSKALGSPQKCQWGWRNENGMKVPHQEEQEIGKLVQTARRNGTTLKQIRKLLQKNNMKTRKGTDFSIPGISRLARTFEAA